MNELSTLSKDKRAKLFRYEEREENVTFFTGKVFSTKLSMSNTGLDNIIKHFKGKDWFLLSNDQTGNCEPNGFGAFLISQNILPKFASHIAAYLVAKKRIEYRTKTYIELKVV